MELKYVKIITKILFWILLFIIITFIVSITFITKNNEKEIIKTINIYNVNVKVRLNKEEDYGYIIEPLTIYTEFGNIYFKENAPFNFTSHPLLMSSEFNNYRYIPSIQFRLDETDKIEYDFTLFGQKLSFRNMIITESGSIFTRPTAYITINDKSYYPDEINYYSKDCINLLSDRTGGFSLLVTMNGEIIESERIVY